MSRKRGFRLPALLWLTTVSLSLYGSEAAKSAEARAARRSALPGTSATDLAVYFGTVDQRVDPAGDIQYQFNLVNYSSVAAQRARFRFQLPSGFMFLRAEAPPEVRCSEAKGLVGCEMDQFSAAVPDMQFVVRLSIDARSPSSSHGGRFDLQAFLTSETPESDPSNNTAHAVTKVYRHYAVTNVLDSGPGSLRDAIEAANRECDRDGVPCRIDFAVADAMPEAGWFTIRPLTALPPILADDLTLDGRTQTSATGDTNPLGPEIELNGELCESGSGLEIHSRGESLVAGLAINGFPENGVLLTGPWPILFPFGRAVRDNYIGTDATGTRVVPNGLRGIACFGEGFGQIDISGNVVSGNGRSGLFLASGGGFSIEGNRIGTNATGDAPLPNGASGIYFGKVSGCGVVQDNVIAYNHDFGVAAEYYRNVAIQRNSIKANRLSGVDFGLDGETTSPSFDLLRAVDHPVLESARYDHASETTVIRGRFGGEGNYAYAAVADIYASPGPDAQGEKWLGQAGREGIQFVLTYPGNLLGRYITATETLNFYAGPLAKFVQGSGGPGGSPAVGEGAFVPCGGGLVHTTSEFSRPILVTE